MHEVIKHLPHGHLIVEVFDVAIRRTLARPHPIYQLLAPRLEYTMAANTSASTKMLAPGGPIDLGLAVGAKGAVELLARGWSEQWDFERLNIPADLAARGVGDPEALPVDHWRGDALQIWTVIERCARMRWKAWSPPALVPRVPVAPLAALIGRKTAGNRLFIRQFLLALVRTGYVRAAPGGWHWDDGGETGLHGQPDQGRAAGKDCRA